MTENQPEVAPTAAIVAPLDTDGRSYDYELIFEGGTNRAYAHEIADLISDLIPGYDTLDTNGQWQARLHTAADAQVSVQAYVNNEHPFDDCTADAQRILNGARYEQPSVATWDEPVPLVLVANAYEPAGLIGRPQPVDGRAPNVVWIDPSDEETLLTSLHNSGYLILNQRGDDNNAVS